MPKPRRKSIPATRPLAFDFNQVARKALHDHPQLKKDSLLIDTISDTYIATAQTLSRLNDDDDALEDLQKTINVAQRLRTSFAQAVMIDSKKTIHALVIHPDRYPLFDPTNPRIDDIGSFDHELGHLLFPGLNGTQGENTADAYAVLRHLQRFEGQQTDIAYAAWKRTMIFIMSGRTSHLTTFTIDKVLIDRTTADFISLTPAQTAAIARDYAQRQTRSQNDLSTLAADFHAARSRRPSRNLFHQITKVTLAADAKSDTFYLGARALMTPLARGKITLDGRSITLHGPEWQKLRARLEKKIATLPPQHPLRLIKYHP